MRLARPRKCVSDTEAAHPQQAKVHQHGIGALVQGHCHAARAVRGGGNNHAAILEQARHGLDDRRVVVDQENPLGRDKSKETGDGQIDTGAFVVTPALSIKNGYSAWRDRNFFAPEIGGKFSPHFLPRKRVSDARTRRNRL